MIGMDKTAVEKRKYSLVFNNNNINNNSNENIQKISMNFSSVIESIYNC
jgi:hypothetical protein